MAALKIYTEDLDTAKAILKRDGAVTRQFFYKQCYPLFKSIYDNYHTDCNSCLEFMNEIYVLVLTPSKQTGKCQLENFRGESTLTSWLKTTCLYYCYGKYERRQRLNVIDYPRNDYSEDSENNNVSDRLIDILGSSAIDMTNIDRMDVETILNLMPCKRYSTLIRLRYLENKTNEETAEAMGMSMDNYYNRHKLAKAQFEKISRKEALL